MTDGQRSELEALSRVAGEAVDQTMTVAEATRRLDDLRSRSRNLAEDIGSKAVDPDSACSLVNRDDTIVEP